MPLEDNIRYSGTLSPKYYFDQEIWERSKDRIFARSWLMAGDRSQMFKEDNNIYPFELMEEYLEEPLLMVNDGARVRCMSNVCTHRAFLLAQEPCKARKITCKYHGRRFSLAGKFEFMPEFREAENFPRPCDDLADLPLRAWKNFLFTGLDPIVSFKSIFDQLDERMDFLDWNQFRYVPEQDTTYEVRSHWALYVENYLEGFHIPFVHETLNRMLDYGSYRTDCETNMVLQTGYTDKGGGACFDLPPGHPDFGKQVTGYYFWIFPNMMFNFYTWGLQVNIVRPVNVDACKVDFIYYIYDDDAWSRMDGEKIAEVTQLEDEYVVEGVQKGLRSRLYPGGRFSPTRENGVHHFQKLYRKYLEE